MKKDRAFSILMATYTGVKTIDTTFASILRQENPEVKYEIIVVIDGPNVKLRHKVEIAKKKFQALDIPLIIKQFKVNQGRFEARLTGAKLSKHGHILIVDDRVELPKGFLKSVSSLGEEVVVPDVEEKEPKNFVSLTLNRLRRRIYGSIWNAEFEPYYIDSANFDSSPKGTTALWVNRSKFIEACEKVASKTRATAEVNEDTRVLRTLVDCGTRIYKTSRLKISYEPRERAKEELVHIYKRGPRFIDYYFRPGTRYYLPLLFFYIMLIPVMVVLVTFPITFMAFLILTLLISVWINRLSLDTIWILFGIWIIAVFFGAGLIKGLISRLRTSSNF